MHREHSRAQRQETSRFLFAFRRDRHPTSFPQCFHRSRSFPFSVHRIIGFAKIRFVTGRMRAAVLSGLIVRGLGNFRSVGVASDGTERLQSVVCRFRTVIVRVHMRTHVQTRVKLCAHALCVQTFYKILEWIQHHMTSIQFSLC